MSAAVLRAFSCFVTGTDTGVGKSLVAAALVRAQAQAGLRVCGMKPVAAGAAWRDGHWHNEDVAQLVAEASVAAAPSDVCPFLLEAALAPHIAAELAGVSLDLREILQAYGRLREQAEAVVVEGVGGFRVPLSLRLDTADLACRLDLPVVLVVGLRLGCLNHAALTAEAIAARGLRLAGWVANRIDPQMAQVERNIDCLSRTLALPLLGTIPHLEQPGAAAALEHLDLAPLQIVQTRRS
jgi:dethiobiotin synthetase